MTFTEAIQAYRQRSLLPEEEILAEQIAEYPKMGSNGHNWLEDALVGLLALDTGDAPPEGMEKSTWQRQIALLDCLLSMAREIVEYRVLLADIKAQIAEARRIAEVVA